MFERFTDRARRVLVLAQEEARLLRHNFIGTEHLLLGLLHEGDGVAAQALRSLDIHLPQVRALVAETIGPVDTPLIGSPPFTPRSKKVLELSLREALQLGHNYIGTEHLLLGLVREGEGVAAQVLAELGAPLDRVRAEVLAILGGAPPGSRPGSPPGDAPRCPHCAAGLAGNAAYRRLDVPDDHDGDAVVVVVVYCRACGMALTSRLVG